jgi:hypothetical protein
MIYFIIGELITLILLLASPKQLWEPVRDSFRKSKVATIVAAFITLTGVVTLWPLFLVFIILAGRKVKT